MKISEVIAALQSIQASRGDLAIVSGLGRSGYGEPIEGMVVYVAGTQASDDVVDLVLSDNCTYKTIGPHKATAF